MPDDSDGVGQRSTEEPSGGTNRPPEQSEETAVGSFAGLLGTPEYETAEEEESVGADLDPTAEGTVTPKGEGDGEGDPWHEGGVSSRALSVLGGGPSPFETELHTDQEDIIEEVTSDLVRYFEEADLDDRLEPPDEAFLEEEFFDFGYVDEYDEIGRRWVREPFAYVTTLYNRREREYHYRVVEPHLSEFEEYVRQDIVEYLRNSFMYREVSEEGDKERVFDEEIVDQILHHARSVKPGSMWKILYYVRRDFLDFGRIDPIMRDPAVEDVSCDGADVPVYVYHRSYRDLETNVKFSQRQLSSYAVRLAQRAGKQISVSDPLIDASLPDGSRIQLTLGGEIATRGANFTIRKFSDVPLSPVDLVNYNTFSVEQMVYFWLAIENGKSLVFAGGTGSGKTTSMNAISFFIPPNAKVVTIEDTREIDLPHNNWIQSVSRQSASRDGQGEVSMYDLLQAALRQRPEYILVGEIRADKRVALTFFQAMGTGHTAYTTLHADSVETVFNRMQSEPLNVPRSMIQDLDIISIQRQTVLDSGRVRRNQQVTEVRSPDESSDSVSTQSVFRFDPSTDTHRRVGDSRVMREVAELRGWSQAELEIEIARREAILQFLLERDVHDYRDVAAVVHLYQRDPELVTERIRAHGYDI